MTTVVKIHIIWLLMYFNLCPCYLLVVKLIGFWFSCMFSKLSLSVHAVWTVLGSWSSVMLMWRLALVWPARKRRVHVLGWCFGLTFPVRMVQHSPCKPHRLQSCVVSGSLHVLPHCRVNGADCGYLQEKRGRYMRIWRDGNQGIFVKLFQHVCLCEIMMSNVRLCFWGKDGVTAEEDESLQNMALHFKYEWKQQ